jgi:hypothetical protein
MGNNHMHDMMRESEKANRDMKSMLKAIENRKTKSEEERDEFYNNKILEAPMLMSPSEPKRKNQYIVKIKGLDVEPFVYQKVRRPIKFHEGWGDMEINVFELIGVDFHNKLEKLLDTNKGFFSKRDNKLEISVMEKDPNGKTISTWVYKTVLTAIDYCDMEYGSSEILNFNLHFNVYDVKYKTN